MTSGHERLWLTTRATGSSTYNIAAFRRYEAAMSAAAAMHRNDPCPRWAPLRPVSTRGVTRCLGTCGIAIEAVWLDLE